MDEARAAAALDALGEVLGTVEPPCRGDDRSILDAGQLHRDEAAFLTAAICGVCPVRALCAAYAEAARPTAGLWAGRVYGTRGSRVAEGSAVA